MSEFIQLHVLTSYAPSNLNRDELGRPKTAVFGNAQRLRVSSQSLKRAWRTSEVFLAALRTKKDQKTTDLIGIRTKDIGNVVFEGVKSVLQEADAHLLARRVAVTFASLEDSADKTDKQRRQTKQLVMYSVEEHDAVLALIARVKGMSDAERAALVAQLQAEGKKDAKDADGKDVPKAKGRAAKSKAKEQSDGDEAAAPLSKELFESLLRPGLGSPDVALFGRMLAEHADSNVEAACQVAHALSVHKVMVEDDFFSAVDDLNSGAEDMGAGHLGTTEFAASLFYLYVCIDRTLLLKNLGGDEQLCERALRGLIESVCTVSPSGKQNSFASRERAHYVVAERGAEQPRSLSVSFLKPIAGDDILTQAIDRLADTQTAMNKVYGPCARESLSMSAVPGHKGATFAEIKSFLTKAPPTEAS